jgi:hypothetical protein
MLKTAILVQKKNKKTDKLEWALVSKKDRKVLKWFGAKRPSDARVQKEEKRIQFFKHQSDRIEKIIILGEEISFPEECANDGFKLSIRSYNIIKEAADPAKKTADSLFKIIQFLFYRTPQKDKRKQLNRVRGKVVQLSPSEIQYKKMSPSAVVGQAVSISRNLLSGLNSVFVGRVLE